MIKSVLQKGVVPLVIIAVIAVILVLGGGTYRFVNQRMEKAAAINSFAECAKAGYSVSQTYPSQCKTLDGRIFSEAAPANSGSQRIDFSNFNPTFRFSAKLSSGWQVEYIPQITAINIYNPSLTATTTLEKSQVFIRYYESDKFLKLTTVDFYNQESAKISGHDAVRYEIGKKAGAPNYAYQPSWRNGRHKLVDIRFSKSNPSSFFVFAYNPAVPAAEFDKFIDSIEFHNDVLGLYLPLDEALKRVTKKPYGIKVSPQDSPISSERFNGIHTGADFEILPGEEEADITVYAICGGKILRAEQARGYGGLLLQECLLDDEPAVVAYGHLDIQSVKMKAGDYLYPGAGFAVLGRGGTKETDFERKHLHLGLHKGRAIVSSGYAATEEELKNWINPLTLFK